jgi:acetyltransferase-like isoleucine patch superfamily enzyme
MVVHLLGAIAVKARRDSGLPLLVRIHKGVRYLWELATARLHLRAADVVGPHARTLGRPRIESFGRLEIGAHVLIRSVNVPVELCTGPDGVLRIGDGARLNYGVSIAAEREVSIGARTRIGPYVMIVDSDFHEPYQRSRRPPPRPVVIEEDVWIGAKASVLRGVRIGRGAIVGTGAVVTRDVEPFAIVAGVPARVVGRLDPERFVAEEIG